MTKDNRAPLQNAAIEQADALLSAAGLPTWTELAETIDDLLRTSIPAFDPYCAHTRARAERTLDRACGSTPALWIQQFGRAYRPSRDPKTVALAISPICEMEDVTPGTHSRIKVPADKLEAVREAVERVRANGHFIEYLPLETDK